MTLKARFSDLHVPILALASAEERDNAAILSMNLTGLTDFVFKFEYAVQLADHAEQLLASANEALIKSSEALIKNSRDRAQSYEERMGFAAPVQTYGSWMAIAAREAAMTLYHFHIVQQSIVPGARQVPSIGGLVNMERLEEARRLFSRHFPHAEMMRNAVGHDAERTQSAASREQHAFSGTVRTGKSVHQGTGIFWTGMEARTLRMARKRKLVSVTVDEASLDRLIEVQRAVVSAFDAVAAAYEAQAGGLSEAPAT